MITKEICRDYALKVEEETGKFPLLSAWVKSLGFPCGKTYLLKLFESYTKFRDYCEVPHISREQPLTLDWIKDNCTIDENQCWNWGNALDKDGYGRVVENDITKRTHRVSYELAKGLIEDELVVRHICDNKQCCNPEHLETGTTKDNAQDYLLRNKRKSGYTFNKAPHHKNLQDRLNYYLSNCDDINECLVPNNISHGKDSDYFRISFKMQRYSLHKLILANKLNKEYSEIDVARHICNNKKCINPNHLIEGNSEDNAIDCLSYSKKAILTENQVRDIKKDMTITDLTTRGTKIKFARVWAKKLGVSVSTLQGIMNNDRWGHINV
jgi:hypothetical protein